MKSILAMLAFEVPEGWRPIKAALVMFAFQAFLIAVVVAGLLMLSGCVDLRAFIACKYEILNCPPKDAK